MFPLPPSLDGGVRIKKNASPLAIFKLGLWLKPIIIFGFYYSPSEDGGN
jgi:hypothetical protein